MNKTICNNCDHNIILECNSCFKSGPPCLTKLIESNYKTLAYLRTLSKSLSNFNSVVGMTDKNVLEIISYIEDTITDLEFNVGDIIEKKM